MGSRANGITVIELLVVMTIISVLLMFVLPSFSAGIDNLVLNSTSQRVISEFRLAQVSARTSGEQVYATADAGELRLLKGGRIYRALSMPRGIQLATSQTPLVMVFLESGQIIGADSMDLTNSRGRRVRLFIDHATGLIRTEGKQ
jgi:prepilin-type N-terminal cleavage/methylation domain-containing protein